MPGKPGQPFGKYLLLDRIAAGGMAEIFRAKYVAVAGVTKSVVIKRILPHYAGNRSFVGMFINEAKIAVSLSHGNIAQIFDFGEIDGEYYLAMEYVYGQPLSKLVRRAYEQGIGVPTPFSLFVAAEICNGLHYAHSRCDDSGRPMGIVHRDVSPQNILVGYEGEVKLVDFGIAKMRSASEGQTEHGALKGKYVYFSPEQARAKPLDGRSDIFACGIVLYELLTGRRPFEGKMMEVLSRIVKGELLPPSVLVPDLPRELEAIVMRALAPRPEDRYQTALEMHDALHTYLHHTEPGFTSGAVGLFVRHLHRAELETDGVRLDVPDDFVEQLERWKQPVRKVSAREPTRQESRRRITTVETEVALPGLFSGWRRRLAAGAALLALGALGAALALWTRGDAASFALAISSRPEGALLFVDGVDSGQRTPARVEGLDRTREHRLELRLEGRRPWRTLLAPTEQDEVTLEASLTDLAVPGTTSLPPGVEARDPVEDHFPAGPIATWPEARLKIVAAEHALSIPASPAARMRLEPERTYVLDVEGVASLEGTGREQRLLRSVFYFGERASGTRTAGSFGQIRPGQPVEVRGLRALYGFILDDSPEDNSGTLKLLVADKRSRRGEILYVDPARHFVARTSRLARFAGLDPEARYRVTVAGEADLGAGGGPVSRLLYFVDSGEDPRATGGGQGVLDGSLEVAGGRALWLLLPDDDPLDNAGGLEVAIAPEAAAQR